MNEVPLYRVVGKRAFRGHEQGVEFPAWLDPLQEQRATMRGSIARIGVVDLTPQEFTFPDGWLASPDQSDHRGAERRLTH